MFHVKTVLTGDVNLDKPDLSSTVLGCKFSLVDIFAEFLQL